MINTDGYQVHEKKVMDEKNQGAPMAWKSGQRTAWLTISIVFSLGLIGTASSGTARESTVPPTSTDRRDVPSQQNHAPIPLKGSPELWKFRHIIDR
ncbi:UNVERIFIED_ORG: hypothetical protein ABIB13_001434 [Arthrobacter sp. UYEF2]